MHILIFHYKKIILDNTFPDSLQKKKLSFIFFTDNFSINFQQKKHVYL